jgi:hypothetical protein
MIAKPCAAKSVGVCCIERCCYCFGSHIAELVRPPFPKFGIEFIARRYDERGRRRETDAPIIFSPERYGAVWVSVAVALR